MGKCKSTTSVLKKSTKKLGILVTVFTVVLLGTSLCFGHVFENVPRAEPTLRFLTIVHRHGERAPIWTYPLDPYKNDSFWPDGRGQLLKKGIGSMFELGRFLRHRYDGFIPSRYRPTDLYVFSSPYDRCIMSVQALLAGLFPPTGDQIWNAELPWRPIPVHSVPDASMDDMVSVEKTCPLLSKESDLVEATFTQDKDRELLNYLSENTGFEFTSVNPIKHLYDNLQITSQQGYKLPEWTRGVHPDKLKPLASLWFTTSNITFTEKKLCFGVLINEIVSNMKRKISATENFTQRLRLYSGHDTTMVRLWQGMNVTQELTEGPNYGAMFIFELHEINDKYRVKILYKKYALDKEWRVLSIKGCENDKTAHLDGMCDFDVFVSAMQPMMITNFDAECQIPQQSSVPEMTGSTAGL